MKAFNHVLTVFVGLAAAGILALTGCGGGGEQKAGPVEDPDLTVAVSQVDQYRELGSRVPDGQFVVLTLEIENKSAETMTVSPADFELQKEATNPEDKYAQANERGLLSEFSKIYGQENMDKLLETVETTVHPKRSVQRYIIYMLPADAVLDNFQLLYKPYTLASPLVSAQTKVNDHRSASDMATSPDEEEAGDVDAASDETVEEDAAAVEAEQ